MGIYQDQQTVLSSTFGGPGALNLGWGNAFPAWFQAIPPERVGPDGSYDYCGLQKRVEALYTHHYESSQLAQLSVSQRGRVVILQGVVSDRRMLRHLIDLAIQVEGTIRVETYCVSFEAESNVLFAV